MKFSFKIFATITLLLVLISCSDKSTNPTDTQSTQQKFSDMIGQANSGFTKISGSEPESSTSPDKPVLTYISSIINSINLKNYIQSSEIPLSITSGQTIGLTFSVEKINNLTNGNISLILKVIGDTSYFDMSDSTKINGNDISVNIKTNSSAAIGVYHFKIGIKDLSTNLVSDYLYFELTIVSNQAGRLNLLTGTTWLITKMNGVDVPFIMQTTNKFNKDGTLVTTNIAFGITMTATWYFTNNEQTFIIVPPANLGKPNETHNILELTSSSLKEYHVESQTTSEFVPN